MKSEIARNNMVKQQIRVCEVIDDHLLDVIKTTPREYFAPKAYHSVAYTDTYIPIGHDEVMMTPREEGMLLQALAIQKTDNILEIGTGTGYLTALLSQLGSFVTSVDIHRTFTQQAEEKLLALDLSNFQLETGDAANGWQQGELYDVIIITSSVPFLAKNYRDILAPNGRLFVIVGQSPVMEAMLLTQQSDGQWQEVSLFETDIKALVNAPTREPFIF